MYDQLIGYMSLLLSRDLRDAMRTTSGALTDAKKNDDVEKEDEKKNENTILIDLASRARTVLAAVRRLEENDVYDDMQRKRRRLRVLVLGADRNEGATDDETEKIFKACGEEIPMDVNLVGPNVPKDDDYAVRSSSSKEVRVAERERRLFHEKERGLLTTTKKEREREGRDEQQQQQEQHDDAACEKYDIAFAFNAGVWGYDSWTESLRRAVERYPKMPVVVTAYSMKECEMDEDCVREAFEEEEIRFVWEAEENKHHGEKVGGEENGRENSAWMCFVSNSGEKVGFRK